MENYPYNPSYPESGNSSPRSREIEFENPPPWEDQPPPNYKVKFMCSYGGKIHPRPHDNQLSYVGGETKILSVDRTVRFGSLLAKLVALCDSDAISFKYQLPGEDLDALISVTNDEDLEHMMHEYDRLYRISPKPPRLRVFAFPTLASSLRSFGSEEAKTEKEKFFEALNSAPIPAAAAHLQPSSIDFMFGSEKINAAPHPVGKIPELKDPVVVPGLEERSIGSDPTPKQRMRIDEQQQGNYTRKSDDSLSSGGEYYRLPDKTSQAGVTGGVPYWTEKQIPGGVFPAASGNEQPVYMIPAPSNAYHAQMVRPVNAQPAQGYYAVQRMPSDIYREQQMYNMFPQGGLPASAVGPPAQKVAGYSEGFGMVRPLISAGVGMATTEAGYPYDSGVGRQVVYSAPIPGQPAQFQALAAARSADMRSAAEAGGKASFG